jgi:hypothetical protein
MGLMISCSKDMVKVNLPITCIGTARPYNGNSPCDYRFDTMYICQTENIGNFQLDDSSKEYMPLFCQNTGNSVLYENKLGEIIQLKIEAKTFYKSSSLYNTFTPCKNDSMRSLGYCFENERITVALKSINSDLNITFDIYTAPEIRVPFTGQIGDFLEINRKLDSTRYSVDFIAVVKQRSLSYDKVSLQEFYSSIDILGNNFKNVISNDITKYQVPLYKYYWNKEVGLVAFADTTGTIWKIVN